MIKIEPLFATDRTQTRALLRHQSEPIPYKSFCQEEALSLRGLTFWQHWLPCRMHVAPSVYVAKEDGVVLGMITLRAVGRSRACWRVEHLVVLPHHRGRGIAQELLRFAFALFGSQGVSHFIAEVSNLNSAALSLLGSCGFRRCAKVFHYQLPVEAQLDLEEPDTNTFRLAVPSDKQGLYSLHQDCLPPDLRLIHDYIPDDFTVAEIPSESLDKIAKRLIKKRTWFWVSQDNDRKVITSAARIIAHQEGDYHLEFAVHQGWSQLAPELVSFVLAMMKRAGMHGMVVAKAYDFQPAVLEALKQAQLAPAGEFSLMAREHWLRAKKPRALKIERSVGIPSIGKPAINLPRTGRLRGL
jgi:GNAT superfamily N-acetyltransferase